MNLQPTIEFLYLTTLFLNLKIVNVLKFVFKFGLKKLSA